MKTINEFDCDCKTSCSCAEEQNVKECDIGCHTISKKELRQSAIEDIKEWAKGLPDGLMIRIVDGKCVYNSDKVKRGLYWCEHTLIGSISAFVEKFNITEDDLK